MEKRKKQKVWSKEKALRYIRSFYRKDIAAADLLRLVKNSLPNNVPALSSNLFYIAYNSFCDCTNKIQIPIFDCRFCECIACVDFDYTNHGTCSMSGMCFYIPATNKRCIAKEYCIDIYQSSSLSTSQSSSHTTPNHPPILKCAGNSCPSQMTSQIPKSGTTVEALGDGLTMVTKVRTRTQQQDRNIQYNDSRFSKLENDISEILSKDCLEVDLNCIQYIRDNVYFNGETSIGLNLIQFEGVNRHARFDEVFCSFCIF